MKKIYLLFVMFCIGVILSGCSNSKKELQSEFEVEENVGDTVVETDNIQDDVKSEESDETEKIEEVSKIGMYTLEECIGYDGVYFAFDDGSFNWYNMSGYCLGGKAYIDGLYLANSDMHSVITEPDKLVLFWEDEYSIELYPVTAQIPVIQLEKEDGTKGFGQLEYSGTPVLKASYRDNEYERIKIQTIDGAPPEDYETEHVEFMVNPYKGVPLEEVLVRMDGFKQDTEVTIGIAQGTALEEKTYQVDATYYE